MLEQTRSISPRTQFKIQVAQYATMMCLAEKHLGCGKDKAGEQVTSSSHVFIVDLDQQYQAEMALLLVKRPIQEGSASQIMLHQHT